VNTAQQYKALGDETRGKILAIIKQQPATAKQLADRLRIAPGTAGHHLQSLEAAGLAMVVARRLVRGIVAKYYTRTAKLFLFERPEERDAQTEYSTHWLDMLAHVRREVQETVAAAPEADRVLMVGTPHARMSAERAQEFSRRLHALVDEFATEPLATEGSVYGLGVALYVAPAYLQVDESPPKV
ncbi:MAG: winged helix-turn-helix transcriptional regulator, partial [Ktedonobacterales bacterium]|nr:winged helix-turn-helix transcriptional regulator [Ktedonobacterales bacterium]